MSRTCLAVGVALLLAGALALAPVSSQPPSAAPLLPAGDWANTFSIVGHDPERKEWGVAVASKVLAVGAAVPFAKAGEGAVATQSYTNVTLGPKGLALMAKGKSAEDALKEIMESDKQSELRQVGVVDAKGNAAAFTGKRCVKW